MGEARLFLQVMFSGRLLAILGSAPDIIIDGGGVIDVVYGGIGWGLHFAFVDREAFTSKRWAGGGLDKWKVGYELAVDGYTCRIISGAESRIAGNLPENITWRGKRASPAGGAY